MGDSVMLKPVEREKIQAWVAAYGTPQQVALRCRIVPGVAEGEAEAASAEFGPLSGFSLFEIVTRSMSPGQQLRRPEVIDRGFRRMIDYGIGAKQEHLGL